MSEQVDERGSEADKHPPFRMRPHRRLLLPDLTPPTRAELRWASEQRRIRRAERRMPRPVPDAPVSKELDLAAPPPVEAQLAEPEPLVPEPPVEEPSVEAPSVEQTQLEQVDEPFDLEPIDLEPIQLAPIEVEPIDPAPDEPAPAAPQWPVALDPVDEEPVPTFFRLRSQRLVIPDPEWLGRGPLIEDPDDIEVPDLDTSLDLDFHPDLGPEHDDWLDGLGEDPFDQPAVDLTPWRPTVVEEVAEDHADADAADDDAPPVVSHLLVVRDPAGSGRSRIAVLDEPGAEAVDETLVLPSQPDRSIEYDDLPEVDDYVDEPVLQSPVVAMPATLPPDIEERYEYEPAPEVPKVWDGRPAPMYWRVLRLRHIRPNGWLRALFFEGSVALAVVLVLAEAASVWTIVVLPLVVAIIVKANDVLVGSIRRSFAAPGPVATERDD